MSVRDGTLRWRLLVGVMSCLAAAAPAAARAQSPAAAQPQKPAAVSGAKAASATGAQKPAAATPAKGQAAAAQKPAAATPAKGKGAAAQKPAAAPAKAAKPAAHRKAAAQKPAAAKPAKGKGVAAQKPAAKRGRKAAPASGRKAAPPRAAARTAGQQPSGGERGRHVVKRRDTLWDLAQLYLGSPWVWPRIYDANRGVVKDPHWIYPGQKLIIPGYGEVVVQPTDSSETAEPPAQPKLLTKAAPRMAEQRTIFYHSATEGEDTSLAALAPDRRPSVERGEFMATPWLGNPNALLPVGRMLDRTKVEGEAERLPQAALINDRIYLRAEPGTTAPAVGSELLLVRVDRRLQPYGRVIEPTALLRVEQTTATVAVARIVQQYGPVLRGEQALQVPPFTPPASRPAQPVEHGVEGLLIGFLQEQPLHTLADLAFVSMGRDEGLKVGDELIAYAPVRSSSLDATAQLPAEDVARLRVIKVEEHTATVRTLSMRSPSLQSGLRVRLVARVP